MSPAAIASWIVQVAVSAAGAAAIAVPAAWAFFRYLGKHWIENRFAKELESFKHAKNKEIEELRGEVNALLDRTVKLHAQEFEVLPRAWDVMSEAFGTARRVASRGQSFPSIEYLYDEALDAALAASSLEDHERAEIRAMRVGHERQARFSHLFYQHSLGEARRLHIEANNYLISKGLFMQPELKQKLQRLSLLIHEAVEERIFDHLYPQPGAVDRWVKADALADEGDLLNKEIERDIQARLWDRKLLPEAASTAT